MTFTERTGFGLGALFRAAAVTGTTGFISLNIDRFSAAEDGFFERNSHRHPQANTLPSSGTTAATAAASAEEIFKNRASTTAAATTAENITEGGENIVHRIEATPGVTHSIDALMTELVVALALLTVSEDFVSLGGFLEFGLCFSIARIAVRVKLHGQLAIGLLDVVLASVFADTKDLVIIAFGHISVPKGGSG
jgi:hypothetical protein